jgi:hypothetical protein
MKVRLIGRGESLCVSALWGRRARTTCSRIFRRSRRRKDRGERVRGGNRGGWGVLRDPGLEGRELWQADCNEVAESGRAHQGARSGQ